MADAGASVDGGDEAEEGSSASPMMCRVFNSITCSSLNSGINGKLLEASMGLEGLRPCAPTYGEEYSIWACSAGCARAPTEAHEREFACHRHNRHFRVGSKVWQWVGGDWCF